jgi:uncharacterized membrane protein
MGTEKKVKTRAGKALRFAGWILLGLCAAALFALVFGIAVMYLWNWLMPGLFGLREITFLQAFALVLLAKILFGGFGGHHGRDHGRSCFTRRSRDRQPVPEEIRKNGEEFERFWRAEGREAFERYCGRKEKPDTE